LKFCLEAAWGLACAHRTGLLHLDVKPANILIENGSAKITDFGIASRLGEGLSSSGTRAFAAPEQLSREDVSDKADVFSWGVTVFALFTQGVTWSVGLAAPEVLEDMWNLNSLPLRMPEDVYRLIMQCMSENPSERPSMEEAADDLQYIMQTEYPDFAVPAKVVERQPLTAAEYNNRAVYMYETGDKAGADEYFRIAAETAADITVPQYNRGLADFFAGKITPAKLLEDRINRGLGESASELAGAARIMMLNGDERSLADNPGLTAASPAAASWLADGAPGALRIERPHTVRYIKPADREIVRKMLTQGGLGIWNDNPNKLPVDFTVSPKRKTLLMDNDKGAVFLGGLNADAEPWTTCMINHEKLRLETVQFLGEDSVLYDDGGYKICDFSNPENLIYSNITEEQARALVRAIPEEWNTSAPMARIMGNFGSGSTLIRHSAEYHNIADESVLHDFEYACLWKTAPYRFLVMAFDWVPVSGGSLVLSNEGEFLVARIDKGDVPPPDRADWLMMRAVSGAVAKSRRDTIAEAASDYERLLGSGDYSEITGVTAALRPLLVSQDENALALWQRIARDFPRGNIFMAAEGEATRSPSETAEMIRHTKPIYPGLPFSRQSAIGKIRFSYRFNRDSNDLVIANGSAPPAEYPSVGQYKVVTGGESSEDGLYQALVYAREGDDGRLVVGRRGILIRVFDVRGPECVLEIDRPAIQMQGTFMHWSNHALLLYMGDEGFFAIDFDKAGGPVGQLPPPVIQDLTEIHEVAFLGAHADELFTGENRFRLCYEILPFPERPFEDPRYLNFSRMLPKRPEEKRAMLLRNGFGNLWTDRLLGGR